MSFAGRVLLRGCRLVIVLVRAYRGVSVPAVMPAQRHANAGTGGSKTLDRYGQGQDCSRHDAEKRSRHNGSFYFSWL
jgi:hypothetical protein